MWKILAITVLALILNGALVTSEASNEEPVIHASHEAIDAAKDADKGAVDDGAKSMPAKDAEEDIYMKAASCPHRFHMGCMLDVVEKSCTGLQAMESCVKEGKCKNVVNELQRIVGALDPNNFEALNKCCCTKAFEEGGYENCKNPDPVCRKAIDDHVGSDLKKNAELLQICLKKRNKSVCKKAMEAATWVFICIFAWVVAIGCTEGATPPGLRFY